MCYITGKFQVSQLEQMIFHHTEHLTTLFVLQNGEQYQKDQLSSYFVL